MNTTLYIHIGIHKTGTTSLQNFLSSNKKLLDESGILYPGDKVNHYRLTKELREFEAPHYDTESFTFSIFNEISLNINKYQKIILSSEGFCESEDIVLPRLNSCLKYFGLEKNVRIIFFYREQMSWLESAYQQVIKETKVRYNLPFQDFFDYSYPIEECNYFNEMTLWASCFEMKNLILLLFSEIQNEHKIYADFFKSIGEESILSKLSNNPVKLNRSLTQPMVEFLRYLNLLKVPDYLFDDIKKQLESQNSENTNTYSFISSELEEKIRNYYYDSNNCFESEFLRQSEGSLFKDMYCNTKKRITINQNENLDSVQVDQVLLNLSSDSNLLYQLYFSLKIKSKNSEENETIKKLILTNIEKKLPDSAVFSFDFDRDQSIDEFVEEIINDWPSDITINRNNFLLCIYKLNQNMYFNYKDGEHISLTAKTNDPCIGITKLPVKKRSSHAIIIRLTVPKDTVIQLFYQTKVSPFFTESQSISKELKKGENKVIFFYQKTDFNGNLRLDPGNAPGIYLIHEIKLKSSIPLSKIKKLTGIFWCLFKNLTTFNLFNKTEGVDK
jgi:hypothetical protein